MVPSATSRVSAPVSAPTSPRSLRILYADDMPELRDVARITLSAEGHDIQCVEDGQVALARVTAAPAFDLVITDHHMPKMNGLELVTRLRGLNFPGRIMVFSSELSGAVAAGYVRLNVDRVLYKPVYPSVLRQTLCDLFPPAVPKLDPVFHR